MRTVNRDIDWSGLDLDGVRVMDRQRHDRKLKRGTHRANAFRLTLVEVSPVRFADLVSRVDAIRTRGVPNLFGAQRFGSRNLELAACLFGGARLKRNQKSLALSAARAAIFNSILSDRVDAGLWDRLVPGDIAGLDGSSSVFAVEDVDAELGRRLATHDVHPTASLWGRQRDPRPTARAEALEAGSLERFADFARGLEKAGVDAARRPCRVVPRSLSLAQREDTIHLSFTLPAGAFATAVLHEFGVVDDRAVSQPPSKST